MKSRAPHTVGKDCQQVLSDFENDREYKTEIFDPRLGVIKVYTTNCGRKEQDVLDRLWARTEIVEHPDFEIPCKLFDGGLSNSSYYKQIWYHGKYVRIHRFALILEGHTLTPNMHVDHLCERKNCWEHTHLEETTPGENTRRYHKNRR